MNDKQKRIEEHSQHEKNTWGEIFKKELQKNSSKKFSSYWWEYYYEHISQLIASLLSNKKFPNVLEAGSGSGKATLLSVPQAKITLLDIAPEGLAMAKRLAEAYNVQNITYIEGNMFSMPFENKTYDFVWNIGALEHYERDLVIDLLAEMLRVTDSGGHIGIAIPNFRSFAIKKAMLLAHPRFKKILTFISGYRLDTEKVYSAKDIENMLKAAASVQGIELEGIKTVYIGSSLIVEAPKFLIKLFSKIEKHFNKRNFLMLTLAKRK